MSEQKDEPEVHVDALYTSTAKDAKFEARQETTVADVIAQAYTKLKEERRTNDRYVSHDEPRQDLTPYMHLSLHALRERGLLIHERHGNLTFDIDIDVEPGGAA